MNPAGAQTPPAFSMVAGQLNVSLDGGTTWTPVAGPNPAQGASIPDADTTLTPAVDGASLYQMSSVRTGNRVVTLGVTGSPITNSIVSVWLRAGGAFTVTVKDDAATTLFTFASAATNQIANFYFNGTHYVFLSMLYTA